MKKRLLLLIDDPNELKELRQALGSMEAIWDTSFGESASKSLEGLSAHPAAAIVATKRHQGSCGVQLLNHVARDHPATLRFMLADATDRELLLACAAQAHQCVVRPCPPAFLIRTLRRALTLDSVVANGRVKEFVSHSGALPALPSLYFSVLNHLDSPASTVQDVAREVAKDIAMTSKLLQLVNAAFLGLRQKVTSASDAISLLGLETLKSLVLSIHVFDHYEKFSSSGFSPERLWSHSLAVANASRQLTLMETRDKRLADEAFTAGLLHDVGKLIFMANATADYRRVIDAAVRDGKDLTLLETEAFGAAHPQAGAYLVGTWGMPLAIQEAVALHHSPEVCFSKDFSPLTAVHVANALQHERAPNERIGKVAELNQEYLKDLGLSAHLDTWRHVLFGIARLSQNPPNKPASEPAAAPAPAATLPLQETPAATAPVAIASTNTEAASPLPPALVAPPSPSRKERVSPQWNLWILIPSGAIAIAIVAILFLLTSSGQDPTTAHARNPKPRLNLDQPENAEPPSTETRLTPERQKEEERIERAAPPGDGSLKPDGAAASETARVAISTTRPAPGFPSIQVQGIYYRAKNPIAIINGQNVSVGAMVSGARVVSITSNTVSLSFQNQTLKYGFK